MNTSVISDRRITLAVELMTQFAERTGLEPDGPQRRYLWTDAFAVTNFLGLARVTGEHRYVELALRLIDRVHRTLGRHRPDSTTRGWISGLSEAEGARHPTQGGLRIGKPLDERAAAAPLDQRLEWDRDGQYFHYLTKWMHALDQTTRHTGDLTFNRWARELAVAAHRAFVYAPPGSSRKRMFWKMSIDLSRPLVPSMGQHDPLDGFVTYLQLEATPNPAGPSLEVAITEFAALLDPTGLATDDPLGIGGLLVDVSRLEQLRQSSSWSGLDQLVEAVRNAALLGLREFRSHPDLDAPADRRLAFRELGLAIGLAAVPLASFLPLRDKIESFWIDPQQRRTTAWEAHADINDVMLATALAPEG